MGWEVDAISAKSVQKRNTGAERRKEREAFCGRLREVDAVSAFPSSTTGYELSRAETPHTFLRFCLCLYLPQ